MLIEVLDQLGTHLSDIAELGTLLAGTGDDAGHQITIDAVQSINASTSPDNIMTVVVDHDNLLREGLTGLL